MNEKRHFIKTFRMTPSEHALLDLVASFEGRNQSEALRECVREAAKSRGILPAGLVKFEIEKESNHDPQ